MEISFTLDIASFWIGVVTTVVVSFVGLVVAAAVQAFKQKNRTTGRGRSRI